MRRHCFCWLLAAISLLASGCGRFDAHKPAFRPVPADQVLDFAQLFKENCAGCHGAQGKLGPAPPLNDPTFWRIISDTELTAVILEGRPDTPMPAFARENGGPLTDAQVKVLVSNLRSHWLTYGRWHAYTPNYAAESPKTGDKDRGLKVFARACAGCHGEDGTGGDMAGAINDHAFLALISDQALRRLVITGRPDLGMPDFAGADGRDDDFKPLTSSEVDDLVALLSHWRRTGAAEPKSRSKTAAR